MNRVRYLAIPMLVVLMGIAVLLPMSASAATKNASTVQVSAASANPFNNIPVTGTASNGGTFKGTLHIQQFAAQNGNLVASGRLSGTLTSPNGTVQTVKNVKVASIPVAIDPTCSVLSLTLGPLDLSLLGLMVHLNQVVLTITANSAGGLLGQLLCSLAGTPPTDLSTIVSLLNQILAAL